MTIPERIAALRTAMEAAGVQSYVVPSSDPHMSEYVAAHFRIRTWLTGFGGSAGTLAVTATKAALWTDSRYWLEAETVLKETGIVLMKQGEPTTPTMGAWLAENGTAEDKVGYWAMTMSPAFWKDLAGDLGPKGMILAPTDDLVASLWEDRPSLPQAPLEVYQPECSPAGVKEKLDRLQDWMLAQGLDWYLAGALDEVAWMLNLRGADIDYNPFFYAWLLKGRHSTTLFVDEAKVSDEIKLLLQNHLVSLSPYHTIGAHLQTLPAEDRILMAPATANMANRSQVAHMNLVEQAGIISAWKARKTEAELESLAECMVVDGIAVVKTLAWVEKQVAEGKAPTEHEVGRQVHANRSMAPDYRGPSFAPIAGWGPNGAIVHYDPPAEGSAVLDKQGILLLDSGGQYLSGTTDITRVLALGTPSEAERRAYTLVLRGHIALARAVFPVGTSGAQLDAFARQALWQAGLNYGHGTGHGVGFFLSVHEGPQRIAPNAPNIALEPGMIVSDEPGYYLPGAFGVRIENLLAVEAHPEFEGFLRFRNLTLAPYEPRLIDPELLSQEDRDWLESYNEVVLRKLKPGLGRTEATWLGKACRMPWQ